jgi:hypothetical protein
MVSSEFTFVYSEQITLYTLEFLKHQNDWYLIEQVRQSRKDKNQYIKKKYNTRDDQDGRSEGGRRLDGWGRVWQWMLRGIPDASTYFMHCKT